VFVTQGAQASGAEDEKPSTCGLKSKPARGQNPQKVSTRKEKNVRLNLPDPVHNTIGPRAHLPGGFAPRAAITKQLPVGSFSMNLHTAAALVLAIVPFEQVRLNLGNLPKTGQLTGAPGTQQRAGQDFRKRQTFQALTEAAGVSLASIG
jgi:hypothetical protein